MFLFKKHIVFQKLYLPLQRGSEKPQ